jgi:hypothetical protein
MGAPTAVALGMARENPRRARVKGRNPNEFRPNGADLYMDVYLSVVWNQPIESVHCVDLPDFAVTRVTRNPGFTVGLKKKYAASGDRIRSLVLLLNKNTSQTAMSLNKFTAWFPQ